MKSSFIQEHSPALESVDFQPTGFFRELTNAFADAKGLKKDAVIESESMGSLSGIVKHYTGMNIVFSIDDYDPCIEIPQVDRNHPLVQQWMRNYINSSDGLDMINKAGGTARGTVSLRTGKVTGVFSDLKATIHMPWRMITESKFSAEECAAIALHEIGHLFTYYEYISRTVTTNQVLAGLSKALDGSGSVDQRETVLMTAKKALKLKELDVKNLARSNNNKVVEIVVVSNLVRETESELGSNVYDMSSWEMLADQYAARYGAGRYIVTALDKLYRGMWNISFRSLPAYLAMEALKLAMVFFAPTMTLGIMLLAMDGSGDRTYDRPGARFKRVRNQVVEALKNPKLSKDDKERLHADLVTLDEVISHVEDRRQFTTLLWDVLVPSARKAYSQERLQQELEQIAMNDLFVKADQLKQLG